MALHGFMGTEIELKTPADKLYNIFKSEAHHLPKINTSGHIQGVDVHEGDWETHGSIKIWQYTIGDEVGFFKEKVELDDENKAVTLIGIDGEMFKYYKAFSGIYKFIPKGEGSIASLTIHYEKLSADVAPPERFVTLMVNLVRDLDAHFVNKA